MGEKDSGGELKFRWSHVKTSGDAAGDSLPVGSPWLKRVDNDEQY
jgi:hypothetical protein